MICPKCNYINNFGNYCRKCGSLMKDKNTLINMPDKKLNGCKTSSEEAKNSTVNQYKTYMTRVYKEQNILHNNKRG